MSVDLVRAARELCAVAGWDATLAGARAHLYDVVGRMWSAAEAGTTISEALLAEAWGAAVTTAMESRAAVADLYAVAGTSALYVDFPLERRLRDIQAMMQHVVVQPLWLEQAGAVKMGLPPTNPLFAV